MANKQYNWRTAVDIISGGYAGEEHGVLDGSTDWNTTSEMSGSNTVRYFYRDSTHMTNAQSSRVVVSITESWTAAIDDLNNLTITANTTVDSIVRDDIRGDPGTATFGIFLRREVGGTVLWEVRDDRINYAHTILGSPVALGSYSFTIAPGQGASRGTVYLLNSNHGHENDPLPNQYSDAMWVGTNFQNILPAPTVYRVTYDANGGTGAPTAQSHTTAQESWLFALSDGTPTWGLYEFLGWSRTQYTDSRTEADVEYTPGEEITLSQSSPTLTLYAVWRMDYRPGAVLDGDAWQSHNRVGGTAHVLAGDKWNEMRTIGSPNAKGNAPAVFHDDAWYNMSRTGKGGA